MSLIDEPSSLHRLIRKGIHVSELRATIEAEPSLVYQREKSETALHTAIRWGRLEHVGWFVTQTPELVHIADGQGYTPLHLVGETLFVKNAADGWLALEIGQMLMAAGASLTQTNDFGQTPLLALAVRANCHCGWLELISLMVAEGADPNARDKDGNTFLHQIAKEAESWAPLELAQVLVKNGADPRLPNAAGNTPLDLVLACQGISREPLDALTDYLEKAQASARIL